MSQSDLNSTWTPYVPAHDCGDNMSLVLMEMETLLFQGNLGFRLVIRHEEEKWRYPGILPVIEFLEFAKDEKKRMKSNPDLLEQHPTLYPRFSFKCPPVDENNYVTTLDISWEYKGAQDKSKIIHAITFNTRDNTFGHGFIYLPDIIEHIDMIRSIVRGNV